MPSVDVLINIHTTYFSCLDMLVTSVQSLLTPELLASGRPGGIPLLICTNPCGSESPVVWQQPAEGWRGHPPSSEKGSKQAGRSRICNESAAGCCSHGREGFFATRTSSRGKLVADSSSLEVIEPRQDIVLDRSLESKPQVMGLNVRGTGWNSLACEHGRSNGMI